MKKYLAVFSICVTAVIAGFAQENDLSLEVLLSAETSFFCDTKSVADFIRLVKDFQKMIEPDSKEWGSYKDFSEAVGIDLLDAAALQEAGVDINRRAGLALIGQFNNEEGVIIIPASDVEKLSQVFTKIVNAIYSENSADRKTFVPVSSSYKNFKIKQIEEDNFITSVNGYFISCSSSKTAHSLIDSALSGKNLAEDAAYLDYVKKRRENPHDLSLFLRSTLLGDDFLDAEYREIIDSIKYFIAGMSVKKNVLTFQGGLLVDSSSERVKRIVSCFKPGMSDMILDDNNSSPIYTFLSLDLTAIDEVCQRESFLVETYMEFLEIISEEYGIDLQKDVIPYAGIINGMTGDITKSEIVIFFPISDASKSLALGKKVQAYMKKKYEPQGLSGYEKVGYGQAAYRFTSGGRKEYIYSDQRGFYYSTSISLLNAAVKKTTLGKSKGKLAVLFSNDVWGYLRIKKNDFFAALAAQVSDKADDNLLNRIGDMNFFFKKSDSFFSLDVTIVIGTPKK